MTRSIQQAAGSTQQAATAPSPRVAARCPLPAAGCPRAFTLTEILVVIVIIVIVLGMAVPVFHFITGSRSEEGAINQIAAMLARARADAIGLQKPIGVAFFTDGNNGRGYMAEVEMAPCPTWSQNEVFQRGNYVKVSSGNGVNANQPPYYYYIYINQVNA